MVPIPTRAQCRGLAAAYVLPLLLVACASQRPVIIGAPPEPAPKAEAAPAPEATAPLPQMPKYVEDWLRAPPPGQGALALLLPLSGRFAQGAGAVRDGFLAQHFASGDTSEVRVYDVGEDDADLLAVYQRAVDEGAGMIVGPLKKDSVARLAAVSPAIPVVGLNYLDDGRQLPAGFYQFGLSPGDEARAAADDAAAAGRVRAVALVPEGDWGSRVLDALETELQRWNGRVVATERYQPGVSDQGDAIARLMGVADSEQRHRSLTNALGKRTEFDARRRGDIDFVFFAARAPDARVLLPQFRFYRATGLPIYATSLVYGGSPDADLDGLRFCDMPFMTDAAGTPMADARAQSEQLADAAAFPRLYAMGRDAYDLATALQAGRLRVGDSLDGASGRLEWSDSSTISRHLRCVQMGDKALTPTSPR